MVNQRLVRRTCLQVVEADELHIARLWPAGRRCSAAGAKAARSAPKAVAAVAPVAARAPTTASRST